VDIRRAFAHGVVEQVVDQLDDRRVPGDFLQVADILNLLLNKREFFGFDFVNDFINHENIGRGQMRLHRGADIARGGGHHLHGVAGELLDFFDQKQIGRFRHGDRQHAIDQKHRQYAVLFKKGARQNFNDLGIADFRRNLGVRHIVAGREGFSELLFGDQSLLQEHFADQLARAGFLLLLQHGIQGLLSDQRPGDEHLPDGFTMCCGRDHTFTSWS